MCLAPGRGICRQGCRRGTENTSLKQKQRLVLETLSLDLNRTNANTHTRAGKNSKKEKLSSTNLLWRKWRLTSAGVSVQLQTNSVRALPQKLNHLNRVNSEEELDISKLLHFCDLPMLGIKVKFLIIRGPKCLNFPDGNFQRAKTFQTKCVYRFRDKKTRKSFSRQKSVHKFFL